MKTKLLAICLLLSILLSGRSQGDIYSFIYDRIIGVIILFTILVISLFVYGKLANKFSLDLDAGKLLIFFIIIILLLLIFIR